MKKVIVFFILVFIMRSNDAEAHQPGRLLQPVVFALNTDVLKNNKSRINAKDDLILPAYKQLLKEADAALQFGPVSVMEKKNIPPSGDRHDYMSLAPYFWPDPSKPNGLPYMRKDGETNPEVKEYKDKEYLPALCSKIYTLALAYYFSEEKLYAEHAAKLLQVWFLDTATRMNPNLNYGQAIKGVNAGRGAGMIDVRHFIKLVDAIGLLNGSKSWSDTNQQGMVQWFDNFLQWMQTSKNGIDEMNAGNNHGAWYEALRLSLALFTGNTELAKKSVLNAQSRIDKQIDENGSFPKEMERTTSLHYTTFAMEAFFNIALMADKAGVDLWNYTTPSSQSLHRSFDVLHPYLIKEKTWQGQQIKDFEYEEGYFLLVQAALHFDCKKCKDEIKHIAGDKSNRLLINLIY